mgnify:CR=1 FL=1
MRKRIPLVAVVLAVLAAVSLIWVLSAQASGPSFSTQVTLTQDPTAGSVSYVCLAGGQLPFPCEYAGGTTVGAVQTGEVFTGVLSACTGTKGYCTLLLNSSVRVIQGSQIWFTGPGPRPGDVNFVGTVGGAFTITKSASADLDGSYTGGVSGTINMLSGRITGLQVSDWRTVDATGGLRSLIRAAGTIGAPISGIFPGHETALASISGTPRDQLSCAVGDVNCDGELDMSDVAIIERAILGLEPIWPLMDVNRDGKVDTQDVQLLRDILSQH